jgi:pimeloyl-ACP methyl ester carboxylesterase
MAHPIASFDSTKKVKALHGHPVLVPQGNSEKGMPDDAAAKWIRALLPNARVSMSEEAGHVLYLTPAEKVIGEIREFVKGVEKHGEN